MTSRIKAHGSIGVKTALDELCLEIDKLPRFVKKKLIAKIIILSGEIADLEKDDEDASA